MRLWLVLAFACAVTGVMVGCSRQDQQPSSVRAQGPVASETASSPTAIVDPSPTPVTAPPAPTAPSAPSPTAVPTAATPALTPSPITRTSARKVDRGSGLAAHDFELTLLDGETLRLSDLRGKVVVLNFWASWCPPCRIEMPDFEEMWQAMGDRGVVFLGISVSDTERDTRDFAETIGVTYPLGLDLTGQIPRAYRVTSLPTTFVIDREGIEARRFGVVNKGVLRILLEGQLAKE